MSLQDGCLFVNGNSGDSYSIPLDGATVKKLDMNDGTARVVISYTPADGTVTETVTLKPSEDEVDFVFSAIQEQINEAYEIKNRWELRYYDIIGGTIDAYTDDGTGRVKDFSIAINADFKVEPASLPDRPYCVRVLTTDSERASILIESDSQEEQAEWVEKICDAIQASAMVSMRDD